ncbi:MAG: hypothetical protein WC444_07160 [Candidatus Paceibacterota bacterium]
MGLSLEEAIKIANKLVGDIGDYRERLALQTLISHSQTQSEVVSTSTIEQIMKDNIDCEYHHREQIKQTAEAIASLQLQKKPSVEDVRLFFVEHLSEFMTQWQYRSMTADRSDLVRNLTIKLYDKFFK